jgi:hypothetical protein
VAAIFGEVEVRKMMNILRGQVKTIPADQVVPVTIHSARMKWYPLLGGIITTVELLSSLHQGLASVVVYHVAYSRPLQPCP